MTQVLRQITDYSYIKPSFQLSVFTSSIGHPKTNIFLDTNKKEKHFNSNCINEFYSHMRFYGFHSSLSSDESSNKYR
jgi:hypothetical protein